MPTQNQDPELKKSRSETINRNRNTEYNKRVLSAYEKIVLGSTKTSGDARGIAAKNKTKYEMLKKSVSEGTSGGDSGSSLASSLKMALPKDEQKALDYPQARKNSLKKMMGK